MNLDAVFIKFNISTENEVVVKCAADGEAWREIKMPLTELQKPDFLKRIKKKIKGTPPPPNSTSLYKCPSCGATKSTFLRGVDFTGGWFCGFCGSHLKFVDGELEIVAKI